MSQKHDGIIINKFTKYSFIIRVKLALKKRGKDTKNVKLTARVSICYQVSMLQSRKEVKEVRKAIKRKKNS